MNLNRLVGFIVGIIGLVLFAVVTVYFYFFVFLPSYNTEPEEPIEQQTYPVAHPQSVRNSDLFLTLRLGVGDFQLPALFQVSADGGMRLRFSDLTAVDEVLSPTREVSAFVAFPSEALSTESNIPTDVMQVMVFDAEGNISPLTTSIGTARKKAPEWSPDGDRIAFMATSSKEIVSEGAPEMWDIFISDMQGNETYITSGAHPHWTADGASLYIMKSNGVVSVDLSTGEESLIYESRAPLNWSTLMRVDNNFRYLALVGPQYNLIVVFEIDSEGGITEIKRFITPVTSAVFSPDGNIISTIYYREEGLAPELSFVNWRTEEVIETLSLVGFETDFLFLTDWVSR